MSGVYDPDLAARSVRDLAVVTDAELAAGIRAAYVEVAERRRQVDGQPREHWERAAYAALRHGRDALAAMPDDVPPPVLVKAVGPVLGQWWPAQPAKARLIADAVQRLRNAAKIRQACGGPGGGRSVRR
ncbi:hypothetical protein ACN27G_29340 [Plantactinospora sp. WMMB334]|uniref:hypothetical protein n=1 Tax=Plantactinospora sp. WMMB334 TaxID=3404119 RepID=UPI003B940123